MHPTEAPKSIYLSALLIWLTQFITFIIIFFLNTTGLFALTLPTKIIYRPKPWPQNAPTSFSFNPSPIFNMTTGCNCGHFRNCLLVHWLLSTSSTDFLSAWMCMTLSAHSIMLSPRGTLTRSCLRRPTRNSPGSSRLTVVDGRVRSMVASLRFWSHTIALCSKHTYAAYSLYSSVWILLILCNFIYPIPWRNIVNVMLML